MTELDLGDSTALGLMPENGIERLLGGAVNANASRQFAHANQYVMVDDPAVFHARALERGATELSLRMDRDWGLQAAYSRDPDGYVLVFARAR